MKKWLQEIMQKSASKLLTQVLKCACSMLRKCLDLNTVYQQYFVDSPQLSYTSWNANWNANH